MGSRKTKIALGCLAAIIGGVFAAGCGSDQPAEGIRPLPSNKGGMSAQHHPGQVATPPASGGQPSGQPQ